MMVMLMMLMMVNTIKHDAGDSQSEIEIEQ